MEHLSRDVVFKCVWNRSDCEEDRGKVMAMWRKYAAIGETALERRASEIVFIIKDAHEHVKGVSTVRPVRARFLNNHFFYEYRCFIAPDFRVPGLDTMLSVKTKDFLESADGSPHLYKGLLMIVENPDIKKAKTLAVWPASEMVFVGYTSQGHHIRVGYFKGAKIDH